MYSHSSGKAHATSVHPWDQGSSSSGTLLFFHFFLFQVQCKPSQRVYHMPFSITIRSTKPLNPTPHMHVSMMHPSRLPTLDHERALIYFGSGALFLSSHPLIFFLTQAHLFVFLFCFLTWTKNTFGPSAPFTTVNHHFYFLTPPDFNYYILFFFLFSSIIFIYYCYYLYYYFH